MTHTITATVPTPVYRPRHPVFQHHDSTAASPTARPYVNGSEGRVLTVTSESLSVAYEVAAILARVFKFVKVDGEPV